ncbi:pneumococcal serine-rich repeat protein-like [Helicoverpa zea]|uniref:pneumococcal serine-rich repeat protein-like n=1 Tax=Helicoverpa zea TaxID=7113 RepID=UPI001F5A6532|nr:pneumococcal serine-rich repeat protein-like [Helicoverpa zea]
MFLVILTALAAVCGAAKLDTGYLPPISARTAGGSLGDLLAPLEGANQVADGLPTGSYTNDVQGVIVDAANPGSRTSGPEPTGLGGPRASYGSTDSKVGDAAFTGSVTGSGSFGANTRIAPGFGSFVDTAGSEADKKSGSNLKFTSDVGLENYSYGYETDNGISVGENGVASGGVQAQGGYSYKGDDGKTYSVTYTADKDGYKPQGQHLPTPHPIPEEILKSLEKNAKEEAAGHVDDGSYDAQKYNDEGDYSSNGDNNGRPTASGGASTASSSAYASQSSQATRPTSGVLIGSYKPEAGLSQSARGSVAQGFGQVSGNKDQSQISGHSSSFEAQFGQSGSPNPQASHTLGSFGPDGAIKSQTEFQNRFGIGQQGGQQFLGSGFGSPLRIPNFDNSPNSAFSSAVATGSGSASAFASTGSVGSGLKNEFNAPSNSFGLAGQQAYGLQSGSQSSAGESLSVPSTATASASVSGSLTQQHTYPSSELSGNSPSAHEHGQSPSSASASAVVSESESGQLNGVNTGLNSNTFPSRFGEGQLSGNSASSGKYESTGKLNLNSKPNGFDSSSAASSAQGANSQPLSSVASASVSGSSAFGASTQQSGFESQKTQLGSTNSQFSGVKPVKPTFGFESNLGSNQASAFNSFGSSNVPASSAGSSLSTQTGSIDATFASSTQKPSITQQQGADDSYYYNQPSKLFVIPISNNRQPNIPVSSSSLQGSKYPSTQTTSTTGQYQGFSSNNGITQAAVSPFASGTSSSSAQFASQSSQLDSKPAQTTQFGQSSSSQQTTQFGVTGAQIIQKPIVQSQAQFSQSSTSQTTGSAQAPTQQYQGTVYQYNKPEVTLSPQGNKDSFSASAQVKPVQISSDNRFGAQQSTSQFGTQSSFQQTQTNVGSNVVSSQIGQKPIVSSQTTGSNYQQTQVSSGSQYNQKPQTVQSSFTSTTNTQNQQFTKPQSVAFGNAFAQNQNQFGKKPSATTQTGSAFQQSQFGLASSQLGQKPQTQGSSFSSTQYQQTQFTKPQSTVGSSATANAFSQGQTQFGKKPLSTTQTGSTFQQSQFGSAGSQFNQKPQSTQGSGLASTSGQTTFGQKPVGTTQSGSYQQSQFGLASSQFGQKPQTQGSSFTSTTNSQYQQTQFTKPQTSAGSSLTGNTFTQSQTQFGKKPSGTTFGQKPVGTAQTGSSFQQSQFGSTVSQVKPQTTQGSGLASTSGQTTFGQKPVGTSQTGSYQQSQFGLASSQFGQKPQTQGSSFTSTTNTQYQQTQFTKPQSTVGSTATANAFSQSQSQFGKKPSGTTFGQKPVGTTQTGSSFQQSQFGSTVSQVKPQVTQGLASTSGQATFDQKPVGSTQTGSSYQQSQFGSTSSQFGLKPQTQGSSFTSNKYSQGSTFQNKPVVSTQTSTTSQQTQFGSTTSQFGQNAQTVQGFGSTTVKPSYVQKPFASSFQQNQVGSTGSQYGQNSQSTQGSSLTSVNSQTSYGKKPVSSQTQFGVGSSQFTQAQSTQFGKKPSTTQTGSAFQQTQSGSVSSQFGQKPLNTQFGSTSSQFGLNSQTSQAGVVSTASQTSFGSKPVNQQNQFGSVSSQFSQTSQYGKKPTQTFQQTQSSQSNQGFGVSSTTAKPSIGNGPSISSQFGQKPLTSQSGLTTQFGQNSQSSQGSSLTSTASQTSFGSKPVNQQTQFGSTGSQFSQSFQTSQFGKKPISASSTTSQTGSISQQSSTQFGQKPQTTQGSGFNSNTFSQSQTTQFVNKPAQIGSTFQQSQLAGSQFNQKPQTSTESTSTFSQSSFTQEPSSTVQTSSFNQQSQTSSGSLQSSQKPVTSSQGLGQAVQTSQSGPTSFGQNTQFSSSQYGQKPQLSAGAASQTQLGQTTQSGNKISGSSSTTGSGFQSQFSSSSGSQLGQSIQGSSQGQVIQSTQYGIKPVGSAQSSQASAQFGSTSSQFGQASQLSQGNVPALTTVSQSVKPQNIGSGFQTISTTATPVRFGSTPTHFGQKPQAQASAFASSSGSKNVASFGNTQTGQVSQFGAQNQAVSTTQKPLVSSLSQNNYQQSQYTQTSEKVNSQSQFGQGTQSNVGTGQFGVQSSFGLASQKPIGFQSTQSSFQQTQFNQPQKPVPSSQGSAFQAGQLVGTQSTQSSVQSSSVTAGQGSQSLVGSGYNYQQPQSVFTTQFGSQGNAQGQKVQQGQSNFNSVVSTAQTPINSGPLNSFGISSTQGSFQQTQGSTQFGAQSTKPVVNGPVLSPFNNAQSFKPASTASAQGSSSQSQSSAVITSQFGIRPNQPSGLAQFNGQQFQSSFNSGSQSVVGSTPEYTIQQAPGIFIGTQQPVASSSAQASLPSSVGANLNGQSESFAVSTVQTPVSIQGYEILSNQGFVGHSEEFGGPRDPPRFDDKTGYHY